LKPLVHGFASECSADVLYLEEQASWEWLQGLAMVCQVSVQIKSDLFSTLSFLWCCFSLDC